MEKPGSLASWYKGLPMSRRDDCELVIGRFSARKSRNCGNRMASAKPRLELAGLRCSCARNSLRSRIAEANWLALVFGLLKTRAFGKDTAEMVFRSKAS